MQWLKDHGVPADGQLVYGNPMVHIPEVAKRIGADLIVVGHRYRSRLASWWSEDEESDAAAQSLVQHPGRDGAAGAVNASAAFGDVRGASPPRTA